MDLRGQRFGKLLVLHKAPQIGYLKRWYCWCECGELRVVYQCHLRKGATRSCGCRRVMHGATQTPEFQAWISMKKRCLRHIHYAGRGIKVCDRWANSFAAFLEDMGPRPTPNHSLDRINNDGHYEPGNCRWATATQQARNTRAVLMITYQGRTACLVEWASHLGLHRVTLKKRLEKWDRNRALTEPPHTEKITRCGHL